AGLRADDSRCHSRKGSASPPADLRYAGAALHAPVVVDEDFRARGTAVEVVPEALSEPDAPLEPARLATGLCLSRRRPANPLRADAPLLPAGRVDVVLVAPRQRAHAQLLRQLVHRLLQAKGTLRMAWGAHGSGGAGVDEHVGLLSADHLRGVQIVDRAGAPGSGTAARRPECLQVDRHQFPILACTQP